MCSTETISLAKRLDHLLEGTEHRPATAGAPVRNRPQARRANSAGAPGQLRGNFRHGTRDSRFDPSQELLVTPASKLSARGIEHRSRDAFLRQLKICSGTIERYGRAHRASFNAFFQRGYAWERLGEAHNAVKDYNIAISLRNDCAKAYLNRANCHGQLGNLDQALADVERAIRLDPKNESGYVNRALLRRKKCLFVDALGDILGLREMRAMGREKDRLRRRKKDEEKAARSQQLKKRVDVGSDERVKGDAARERELLGRHRPVPALLRASSAGTSRSALKAMIETNEKTERLRVRQRASVLARITEGNFQGARELEKTAGFDGLVTRTLWSTRPSARSHALAQELVPSLSGLQWARKAQLPPETLLSMCKLLKLRFVAENATIITKGEEADEMFLVLSGATKVMRDAAAAGRGGPAAAPSVRLRLWVGDGFGESALQMGAHAGHIATVVADQDTELLVLSKDDYNKVLDHHEDSEIDKRAAIFRICSAFPREGQLMHSGWSDQKLRQLALGSHIESFESGVTIYEAGQPVRALGLVVTGLCKVVQQVLLPSRDVSDMRSGKRASCPTGFWSVSRPFMKTQPDDAAKEAAKPTKKSFGEEALLAQRRKAITIAILCSGQVFGEAAVVDPHGRCPNAVVADTRVDVLMIDKSRLLELEAPFVIPTVRFLKESLALNNPSAPKVVEMWDGRRKWQHERVEVMKRIGL